MRQTGERPNDPGPPPPDDPRQARRRFRRGAGVPLAYVPGPWSACTPACGGAGLQTRPVSCEVRGTHDCRLAVDEQHCLRRELARPNDMQDCGFVMCPMWQAGNWSEVIYSTIRSADIHNAVVTTTIRLRFDRRSTPIRLQFHHATTIRRPTSGP